MNASRRSTAEEEAAIADESMVHLLTPEEAWESFDEAARRSLGMSGEAFIAAWDALIRVAMLRPVGR